MPIAFQHSYVFGLGEDVIFGFGPLERLGIIMLLDVAVDCNLVIDDGAEDATFEAECPSEKLLNHTSRM